MLGQYVRRRAREAALHFLFGLDFTSSPWESVVDDFWAMEADVADQLVNDPDDEEADEYWVLERLSPNAGVREYAMQLIGGVCEHVAALDQEIATALQNWTPERVGRVERAILRIALYEMRYVPDVPPPVAINEAIEIVKRYGDDEAPRFVNGVLDRLRERDGRRDSDAGV